jgi:hypothetical protein
MRDVISLTLTHTCARSASMRAPANRPTDLPRKELVECVKSISIGTYTRTVTHDQRAHSPMTCMLTRSQVHTDPANAHLHTHVRTKPINTRTLSHTHVPNV